MEADIEALERKVLELALRWRAEVPIDQWRRFRRAGMTIDDLKNTLDELARARAERPAPDHPFQVPHSGQDRCVEAVRQVRNGNPGYGVCARPAAEHPKEDPVGKPCSFPGCGKPTAYLPVNTANSTGMQWRHVNPEDEADSHVGYPMSRDAA